MTTPKELNRKAFEDMVAELESFVTETGEKIFIDATKVFYKINQEDHDYKEEK